MTQETTQELFAQALQRHQAGNLPEAQAMYRQILQRDPDHPGTLHLLGVLELQQGRAEVALSLINRAISIQPSAESYGNLGLVLAGMGRFPEAIESYHHAIKLRPEFPEAHCNLGNALRQLDRLPEAIEAYRRAIELRPQFGQAHNNLGLALLDNGDLDGAVNAHRLATELQPASEDSWNNLAAAIYQQGDFAGALGACRKALELNPDYPEAHNNLGNALKGLGRTREAFEAFRQVLGLRPDFPEAHNNLGLLLQGQGKLAEAINHYQIALKLRPDFAEGHYNLAIALKAAGDLRAAITESRLAATLKPCWPEAWNNLGILLQESGELDDAAAALERAIAHRPDYAEAHSNLGNVLRQMGRVTDAVSCYRKAVILRQDYAEAHNNLGNALKQVNRFEESIAAFHRAIELQPSLAEAHNNLGNVLKDQGELDEALECYERASALAPQDAATDSNRIYTLYFHQDSDAQTVLREHLLWNQRHAGPLSRSIRDHDNDPSPRRLRIGYVSPDFRDHCQAMFTLPLLSNHDRSAFEIFCYADVPAPDAITYQLRGHADRWRSIVGMTDQQAAEQIRRDKIDVLVDLSVHMANNRLLVFARKPAPVQVTWLGYPGTTGLEAMDYRLSDPYLDPPGDDEQPGPNDRFYSEKTIRLPDSFWCYDPLSDAPCVSEPPAVRNGYVTFGCLNNFCKVTGRTLELWAKVLAAVPGSRLLVLVPRGGARERLLERLGQEGVDPTRIEFTDRQPRSRYLELYHRIDISLDTFPYNGHTTSLDSMWMGVPVVTIVGRTAVGRGGWSQLCNLGLKELAARSEKHFPRVAMDLAADLNRLRRLRSTLRERLARSPLMNAPRFARGIEAAYRRMWQEWSQTRPKQLPMSA